MRIKKLHGQTCMTSSLHIVRLRQIGTVLAPLALLLYIVFLQLRFDQMVTMRTDPQAPIHRTVMPASVVQHLTFGFDNVIADYYWVTAVQHYLKWDGSDVYYPEYFHIISTLDSQFEYPYLFAILTVPSKKNPESLMWMKSIAERGVNAFPENWQIPFSAATQFHVEGKLNEQAIHFLEIANAVPNSPEMVPRTYGIYLMRDASDYKKSRALFETILVATANDEVRRIIIERILLLDLVEALEQAIYKYQTLNGEYPHSIDELLKKQKLQLPDSYTKLINKFAPQIDQTTGKIILR